MTEPTTEPIPTDLITTNRAAAIAGVHVATLYRWVLSRRLRAWKQVGRLRVSETELRALLVPRLPARDRKESAVAEAVRARAEEDAETVRVLREAGFRV